MKKVLLSIFWTALKTFGILLFISFFLVPGEPNYDIIRQARDKVRIGDIMEIYLLLNAPTSHKFTTLADINNKLKTKIKDPKTCYFYKSIENGSGFILAAKFESKSNTKKYSSPYFIKTKPDLYNVDDDLKKEIEIVTSKPCSSPIIKN